MIDKTPRVFNVTSGLPSRLDAFVVAQLTQSGLSVSRSTVQNWIEQGHVSVDGTTAQRAGLRLRPGATVLVIPQPPPPTEAVPDPSVHLRVVYEDPHVIVIDKPAGLVVHPARGHATGTLVNGLLAGGFFDIDTSDQADPADRLRPGIVHRLDKDTSGVLVVARTPQAREELKRLFAAHSIERKYLAVVVGEAQDATYDARIGRHPTDRLRFSTRTNAEGKRAVTHVQVVERFGRRATLMACTLETGRTHQIRVHLAECSGTPVLGDSLYGSRPRDPTAARIAHELGRQWLHAAVLGFRHPMSGEFLRFESALPAPLVQAVEELRLASR